MLYKPYKQRTMKQKKGFLLLILFAVCGILHINARTELTLEKGWKFAKGDFQNAMKPDFDDLAWQSVTVPHDWAIYGPFDKNIDMQVVRIEQNNEKKATEKTGRTGALPYTGVGWYRTKFNVLNT